jgi:hypothetical protein
VKITRLKMRLGHLLSGHIRLLKGIRQKGLKGVKKINTKIRKFRINPLGKEMTN